MRDELSTASVLEQKTRKFHAWIESGAVLQQMVLQPVDCFGAEARCRSRICCDVPYLRLGRFVIRTHATLSAGFLRNSVMPLTCGKEVDMRVLQRGSRKVVQELLVFVRALRGLPVYCRSPFQTAQIPKRFCLPCEIMAAACPETGL